VPVLISHRLVIFVVLALLIHPAVTHGAGLASAEKGSLTAAGLTGERVSDSVLGGSLVWYRGGDRDNPAVVLIHGVGDNGVRDFASIVPELVGDYHVLAMDLPGFGASDRGNRLYEPDAYVALLHELISTHAQDPVRLVGHSMGGALALRYAAEYPQRVDRVLVTSVPAILHPTVYLGFLVHLGVDAEIAVGDRAETPAAEGSVRAFASRVARRVARYTPETSALSSRKMRKIMLGGEPARIAGLALARTDYSATLDQISAPVALLWGERDEVAPVRTGRLLASRLPPRDLTVLDNVGHVPMTEAPEAFSDWVKSRLTAPLDAATWEAPPEVPGDAIVRCQNEPNYRLTGRWKRIELDGCRHAVLDRVAATHINVRNSTVRLVDPRVRGDAVGIFASGSQIVVTGGEVTADVAVALRGGHLDAAGARLVGRSAALRAEQGGRAAEASFSVSQLVSGQHERHAHEIMALQPGETR